MQWATASDADKIATTRANYAGVTTALADGATPVALAPLDDTLLASVVTTTTRACDLGDAGTVYLIQFRIFGTQAVVPGSPPS